METPQKFLFRTFIGLTEYQILSNGNKIVILNTCLLTPMSQEREVIYLTPNNK